MDLQTILPKLPQVREWIEHTLASHRTEARPVASYRFPRLPQFFPHIFLETSFAVIVARVPVVPLASLGLPEFAEFEKGNYAGITYRNTFFVREDQSLDESLFFHELIHVVQWQQLNVDGFLTAYAAGLIQHGYRNNPLEVMAYDLQARFDQGMQPTDVKALVRTQMARLKS